jgi:ATP-dependent Clp protease protease subunit
MKLLVSAFLIMLCMLSKTASAVVERGKLDVIEMTSKNVIILQDQVTESSVSSVISQLMQTESEDIVLYINSPGGEVIAGSKLINAMYASGKNIVCVADFAVSMAFSIFQACPVRYIVPSSILMQHQISYGVRGSSEQIQVQVQFSETIAKTLNNLDAARLKIHPDTLQRYIQKEWWLYDEQILQHNAADKMILVKCSAELTKSTRKEIVETIFGEVEVTWSGCPLILQALQVKIPEAGKEKMTDLIEQISNKNWKNRRYE